MKIPIINGIYKGRSLKLNTQECINLYPELNEGSKSNGVLIGTPGLSEVYNIGIIGTGRGLYRTSTGKLYAVFGNKLYRLTDSTYTLLQTINSKEGKVSFADNGSQVVLVDGYDGWLISSADSVSKISMPSASHVAFQDGFFIINEVGTGKFYISNSYNGSTWDALDFATAEGSPDNLIALTSNGENIWLLGEQSTEVWYNAGNSFPFVKVPGTNSNIGCSAKYSVATLDNVIFWVGGGANGRDSVYMSNGYTPQRISTHAIEYLIGQETNETATAFCYTEEGHSFYVLNFSGITLAYDITTGIWHRRAYLNDGELEPSLAYDYAFYEGKRYVISRRDSILYETKLDYYTDAGDEIRRVRTFPHLNDETRRIRYNKLTLDMDTGLDSDLSPYVMMSYSNDGGYTFGDEISCSTGALGEYSTLVEWRRLGIARDRVFKIAISADFKICINNAYLTFR